MLLNFYIQSIYRNGLMAVEQNIIALMYDCDLTLTPVYMQEVLFHHFNVDGGEFWRRKDEWQKAIEERGVHFDDECAYMNWMLRYVREGKFAGLSNGMLRELGKNLPLYEGLPDFFGRMNGVVEEERFAREGISVEHYVISTGMRETILGSDLGKYLKGVFASEFYEEDGVIAGIARTIGYAKKTEFIHLISKGGNEDSRINVNSKVDAQDRRVPFRQMIYVGDGPTDVPCFATLKKLKGRGVAVYNPTQEKAFRDCYQLQEEGRVSLFCPADYRGGSHISNVLEHLVCEIAEKIVERNQKKRKRGRIREAVRL